MTINLVQLLISIVVISLVLYFVNNGPVPVPYWLKMIVNVLVFLCVVIWLITTFFGHSLRIG